MVCMPKPSTASSSGTTAVIGELSKMLIHMPMTSSTARMRPMATPTLMPTNSDSAMPMPKALSVIPIASRKLCVMRTLPMAASTAESGGISMISVEPPDDLPQQRPDAEREPRRQPVAVDGHGAGSSSSR